MASKLTVIVPTVCSEARSRSLMQAIASAHESARPAPTVLVVANGPQVCESVYARLQALPMVQTLRLDVGSLPGALLEGRKHVQTEFFAFLDDDDVLLPGSSDLRLQALQDATVDVALVNGYRESSGTRSLMQPNMEGIESEPLRTLLEANWFASCAAVFRSASIGVEMFENPQPFAEWTWLAYRLILAGRRFRAIEAAGYVIHDTPASLSKSSRYFESYISLFDRMLAEKPPAWARRRIVEKRCAAFHDLSNSALLAGAHRKALALHLRSLASPAGLRYFLFGRKVLLDALKSVARR